MLVGPDVEVTALDVLLRGLHAVDAERLDALVGLVVVEGNVGDGTLGGSDLLNDGARRVNLGNRGEVRGDLGALEHGSLPEPASRLMTLMVPAVPPTSDQSVIWPVKMPASCSVVMSSMSTLAFTIGPMPTMHTWLSTRPSSWDSSSTFSSANTSERPIWREPSTMPEMPSPEPPPEMAMTTSGLASWKSPATASTSGWNDVAPPQLMVPERLAPAAALPVEPAVVVWPLQPARPRPATAAMPPAKPRN